ncbi:MAG: hypothetical protein SFU56_08670 [Capsulimonadales bacterium]|nr:hypothetical protein [Capsulimonadales bacterium]
MSERTIAPEDWGRFTFSGGDAVEARLRDIVSGTVRTLKDRLRPESVRALVLIGGYGRGEGGVEVRPDGTEYPHNNLDFLLIGRGGIGEVAALKAELDPILEELSLRLDIGLDLGITTEARLNASPCLIMWYDMRYGHKTLWGDASYVPSLTRFEAERIPTSEARNLLVNRGTLLVINDALIERGIRSEKERRTVVRHAVKAIIGYGDALLYFRGEYHWSYAEKRKRMAGRTDVSAEFRALYDVAMGFRFRPDYGHWSIGDSEAGAEELRQVLGPIHLECERLRLRRTINWDDYLMAACAGEWTTHPTPSLRAAVRRVINLLRVELPPEVLYALPDLTARWGARSAGPRGVLPLLFPVIAYHLQEETTVSAARAFLNAADTSLPALRRAYLRAWGQHGDINFGSVLRKLGLSVEESVMDAPVRTREAA